VDAILGTQVKVSSIACTAFAKPPVGWATSALRINHHVAAVLLSSNCTKAFIIRWPPGLPPQVTTVDGPVELKIPPGTQPGTTLLMAKRGVPRLGNSVLRGDHQVGRQGGHRRAGGVMHAAATCEGIYSQHQAVWRLHSRPHKANHGVGAAQRISR
jgi:hypothetical protein